MTADRLSSYANALVSLGEATGELARIERELLDLLEIFKTSRELRNFLGDLTIEQHGKAAALDELLEGRVHHVLVHFILMLHAEKALPHLETVATRFFAEASARRSKASGLLTVSGPISDDIKAEIEAQVGRILGKDVNLLVRQDTSLLGGMRVQVGDFVVDGTIDRQLDDMRSQLTA